MPKIILGLGSNMGDRAANLAQAISKLSRDMRDIQTSCIYESKAVLPEDAPADWDMPYYNMAISGNVECSPKRLLELVQKVEAVCGRTQRERWAPREIDIDILAYEQEMAEEEGLVIPHPLLVERDFALIPLTELWPDWRHPLECKSAQELLASKGYGELTKVMDTLDAA